MIEFRNIEAGDSEMIRNWRNLPEVRKYMFTDHHISPKEHEAWFQGIGNNPRNKYWIIVYDNEDIGLVNIYSIDEQNKRCYWGRYIAHTNLRGKGIGTYVEYWVLQYVFDKLGLNKLCTEVLGFNEVVLNMHTRFGFHQEGLFREHIFKDNKYYDVVAMAILRSDWKKKKPEIEERLRQFFPLFEVPIDMTS